MVAVGLCHHGVVGVGAAAVVVAAVVAPAVASVMQEGLVVAAVHVVVVVEVVVVVVHATQKMMQMQPEQQVQAHPVMALQQAHQSTGAPMLRQPACQVLQRWHRWSNGWCQCRQSQSHWHQHNLVTSVIVVVVPVGHWLPRWLGPVQQLVLVVLVVVV